MAKINDLGFVRGYVGEPFYMSPKMAIEGKADFSTDNYSLAIIHNNIFMKNAYSDFWEGFFDKFQFLITRGNFQEIHAKTFEFRTTKNNSEFKRLINSNIMLQLAMVIL